MKLNKKISLGASLLLMLTPMAMTSAQTWNARTVEEIRAEIQQDEDHKMVYLVQYGDTLGAIAEAMDIELSFLAQVNQIENVDLIFPDTKLIAEYDENHQAERFIVETENGEQRTWDVPVDLSPIEENLSEEVVIEETIQTISDDEAVVNVTPVEDFEEVVEDVATTMVPESAEIVPTTDTEESNSDVMTSTPNLPEIEVLEPSSLEEMDQSEDLVEEELLPETIIEETTIETEIASPTPEKTVANDTSQEVVNSSEELFVEETVEETFAPVEETVVTEEVVGTEKSVEEPLTTVEPAPTYPTPPGLSGVSADAAAYASKIVGQYGVTAYGLRPGDGGDHGRGKAIDFMVPVSSAMGDQIAADAIANMSTYNISYVIWKQQIYGNWTGGQWQMMEDRGGVTANHYDHVHVSFN